MEPMSKTNILYILYNILKDKERYSCIYVDNGESVNKKYPCTGYPDVVSGQSQHKEM